MADLTHAQVIDALLSAALRLTTLKADRATMGNRETAWTLTDRAFRVDSTGWEDLGWYRADRLRIAEHVVFHLVHRVAADQRRSEAAAAADAQRLLAGLVQDRTLLGVGIVVEPGGPTERVQSGDLIETDVVVRVEYDLLLAEAA
jgi:sugar phosphate isomerase/epimerase